MTNLVRLPEPYGSVWIDAYAVTNVRDVEGCCAISFGPNDAPLALALPCETVAGHINEALDRKFGGSFRLKPKEKS